MTGLHPLVARCFESAGLDVASLTSSRNVVTNSQSGERFFAKTGRNVAQMRGETQSLRAMGRTASKLVPRVIGFEVDESGKEAGMVSQYFDLATFRSSGSQETLGKRLAEMHKPAEEGMGKYGFDVPTHCGVTEQDNRWEKEWEVFFRDRRLGDLVRRLGDGEITSAWEKMRNK